MVRVLRKVAPINFSGEPETTTFQQNHLFFGAQIAPEVPILGGQDPLGFTPPKDPLVAVIWCEFQEKYHPQTAVVSP